MTPFRLIIKGEGPMDREILMGHTRANAHLPRIEAMSRKGRRLAVVGGGPLVIEDLPELQAWDGDVWGINFTAQWLNENRVRATLFGVDPINDPFSAGVTAPDAILGSVCDPRVMARFEGHVQTFDMLQTHADGLCGGSFSSTCAASVALHMGYTDVSFFGCEGSYIAQDHVDRHEAREAELIVRAGGRDYRTCPPFLIQCEELIKLFYFDGVFHNRSGGLLKAMIDNPDTWEVVAVSAALKNHLEAVNGASGLYDGPYVPAAA